MYELIKGKVIKGKTLGNKIGFPTANIELKDENIEDGSYKINGVVDGKIYHGAGVYLKDKNLFEAHFFNFDKNIYDTNIEIVLLYKIRENKKFNSLEELKKQIKKDIKYIKKTKDIVMTFGTFDIVHPGHKYYLENAKKYGDKLITIIATDENTIKFKGKAPLYNSKQRARHVKELGISDIICIGNDTQPLKWIELYEPSIICLGYDQVGFIEQLNEYINKNLINTKIIRIGSYKENIHKSSIIKEKMGL